jgi:hypothetical protein
MKLLAVRLRSCSCCKCCLVRKFDRAERNSAGRTDINVYQILELSNHSATDAFSIPMGICYVMFFSSGIHMH